MRLYKYLTNSIPKVSYLSHAPIFSFWANSLNSDFVVKTTKLSAPGYPSHLANWHSNTTNDQIRKYFRCLRWGHYEHIPLRVRSCLALWPEIRDPDRYYRLKPKVSSTPESRNTHHIARPDVGQPTLPESTTRIIATTVYRLNRSIVSFTSVKLGSSD